MAPRWLALESNPEVLTEYIHALGVDDDWSLVDVLGLDDDLLAMLPQPVAACLLVYPVKNGVVSPDQESNPNVFFLKQTIDNACGTIGLLNAFGNSKATFKKNSALEKFFKEAKGKSPDEVARLLETNEEIRKIHETFAQKGQTSTPGLEEDIDMHFVALVLADGHVQELDGRKNGPIKHLASNENTFLKNWSIVCKQYMSKMPDALNFSLTALVKQ